jgi:hypothetical protein
MSFGTSVTNFFFFSWFKKRINRKVFFYIFSQVFIQLFLFKSSHKYLFRVVWVEKVVVRVTIVVLVFYFSTCFLVTTKLSQEAFPE